MRFDVCEKNNPYYRALYGSTWFDSRTPYLAGLLSKVTIRVP